MSDMREAFEKRAKLIYYGFSFETTEDGLYYTDEHIDNAWIGWKAAQALSAQTIAELQALNQQMRDALRYVRSFDYRGRCNHDPEHRHYHDVIDEAISHTSPTDALDRFRNEVEAGRDKLFCEAIVKVQYDDGKRLVCDSEEILSYINAEKRRMKKGE